MLEERTEKEAGSGGGEGEDKEVCKDKNNDSNSDNIDEVLLSRSFLCFCDKG